MGSALNGTTAAIAKAVTAWYATHGRDLPWRRERDPWRILVSEILLQQTRVETVAPRYREIIAAIPTPQACAALDDDRLHRLWAGLGYYRRARNLRKAARQIAVHGRMPDNAEALRALAGVGPYTAGAVAAIAYNRPEAGIDGNLARVYARLTGREAGVETIKPEAQRWLQQLYKHGEPRILMQALMDLGAQVCTPRRPACLHCPLRRAGCTAATWPDPTATPQRTRRKPTPIDEVDLIWLCGPRGVYLEQRPPGLLGERPAPPIRPHVPDRTTFAESGIYATRERAGAAYRHVFTHRRWQVWPSRYRVDDVSTASGLRCVPYAQLPHLGLPRACSKALPLLAEAGRADA